MGRGQCLAQLGLIAYERFREARASKRPAKELNDLLAEAAQLYEQALEMCPETAITDRGITHNQLGNIYSETGDIDRVLQHYRKSIGYKEQTGDLFGAGQTRYNVTLALRGAGRLDDARAYAEAALANFQTFGERATTEIQATESLITKIDKAAAEKRGGRASLSVLVGDHRASACRTIAHSVDATARTRYSLRQDNRTVLADVNPKRIFGSRSDMRGNARALEGMGVATEASVVPSCHMILAARWAARESLFSLLDHSGDSCSLPDHSGNEFCAASVLPSICRVSQERGRNEGEAANGAAVFNFARMPPRGPV
jgi:tetratricopeptide (TPR) repeat protein